VALSLLRKKWGPNNIYACARQWKNANEQYGIIESLERKGQVLRVYYEKLVTNPVEECTRIYRFIGEDPGNYEDEISSLTGNTLSSNFDKWKGKLSPYKQKVYESVAGECLRRHGYMTIYPAGVRINFFQRLIFNIHDQILYVLHMIDQNLVDTIKIKYLKKEPFGE